MRPNEESSTASGAQASASGSSTAARASTSSRATRPAAGSASTKKTIEGTRRPTRPSGQARVARSTRKCSGAPPRSTKTLWTMSAGRPARERLRHDLVGVQRLPPDGGQRERDCDRGGAEPGDRRPERPAMIEHVEDCSDRHGSDDPRRKPSRLRSDALVGGSSDNAGWLRNEVASPSLRLGFAEHWFAVAVAVPFLVLGVGHLLPATGVGEPAPPGRGGGDRPPGPRRARPARARLAARDRRRACRLAGLEPRAPVRRHGDHLRRRRVVHARPRSPDGRRARQRPSSAGAAIDRRSSEGTSTRPSPSRRSACRSCRSSGW